MKFSLRTCKLTVYNKPLITILTFVLLLISGCSLQRTPTGVSEINVPNIPSATVPNTPLNVGFKPYVLLDQVKDLRQVPELIRLYEKKIKPRGKIEVVTRYAFRSTFRQRGFTVTDNAPVILIPTIKKWLVTVNKDQAIAETVIALDVLDPSNQVIYSSSYDGFLQFSPTSDENKLRDKLGESFAKALTQMINDAHLLGIITAF